MSMTVKVMGSDVRSRSILIVSEDGERMMVTHGLWAAGGHCSLARSLTTNWSPTQGARVSSESDIRPGRPCVHSRRAWCLHQFASLNSAVFLVLRSQSYFVIWNSHKRFFPEALSMIIKVLLLWELYERCIIYVYSTQGKSLKMLWVFFVLVPLDKVLFKILGWTPTRLCLWWTDVQCNIIFSCFCWFWDVMHRPPLHPPLPSLTTIYCTFYSWHWLKIYNICPFPLRKSMKDYNHLIICGFKIFLPLDKSILCLGKSCKIKNPIWSWYYKDAIKVAKAGKYPKLPGIQNLLFYFCCFMLSWWHVSWIIKTFSVRHSMLSACQSLIKGMFV